MILYIAMIVFSPITAIIPGIYATYLILKGKVKIQRNYLNVGLLILFIWSIVVAILNNSILSFGAAFLLLLYFSVSVISQKYFTSRSKINKSLQLITYFTTMTAVNGIIEKVAHNVMNDTNFRVISSYGNPNMAGAWFSSIILVNLYLKSISKDKEEKRIYNLCMFPMIIALFLTKSSGAFIALILSLVMYYMLKNIKDIKKMIIAMVCVAVVSGILLLLQGKGEPQGIVTEVSNSFNSRYDIWIGSLKMISEKPLMGWGVLGTLDFGNPYFTYSGTNIHSHNIYLSFLVSTGIIGLAIYLYVKYNLFKNLLLLIKRDEPLLPLLVALNIMIIIQGLVDNSLYAPQIGMLFVAISSIIINLVNNKVEVEKQKSKGKIINLEVKSIAI